MAQTQIIAGSASDTDALFDTSPQGMAIRFGLRAIEAIRSGAYAGGFARMAFSYAFLVNPTLRQQQTEQVH